MSRFPTAMRRPMPKLTAALALLIACLATADADAQQSVAGAWQVQQVRGSETPQDTELSFNFADAGKATLTTSIRGDAPQSWTYAYTVEGNTLTLMTTTAPGTPEPLTYEMRFKDGKLLLLEPLPETEEGAPPPDDDREPVWVLVRP